MKPYKPFPTMQKEVNYIKCQIILNMRMSITKTKVYVHWSRVTENVPMIYFIEQNWWSQVKSMIQWSVQGPS